MPSPSQRSVDLPVQTFGGRVTQFDPQQLPMGASPFCQDVSFSGLNPSGTGLVAGVATRPGMQAFYAAPFAGNPTVSYLKTFFDSAGIDHLLSIDGLGVVRDESPSPLPPGVPSVIGQVVAASLAQSDSLINREWIAISDTGGYGIDIPRQYDAINFDRVSQEGPGLPPSVQDNSVALATLSRTSNLITGSALAAHGVSVGGLININGVTADITFNGQWPVTTVASATDFTAWGAPGTFPISFLQRVAGTVTVTLASPPDISPGDDIIIYGAEDSSYNGLFTSSAVVGNTVSWAQAGQDSTTSGGVMYTEGYSLPITLIGEQIGATYASITSPFPPAGFAGGAQAIVAGNTLYDGTYTINQIQNTYLGSQGEPAPLGQVFLYFNLVFTDTGYGGTITASVPDSSPIVTGVAGPAGNIPEGLHLISVSFVTREQFITKPAKFAQWYAAGGFQALVSLIPIGPPNIIQRILIFTPVVVPPATTGPFFYFDGAVMTPSAGTYPNMVIGDNTTVNYTVNFDDTALQLGTAASSLFNLLELGEVSNFCAYSSRLFACGERNKLTNFTNLSFDGGTSSVNNLPLGWSSSTLGNVVVTNNHAYWGGALELIGDGTLSPAEVHQTAYQDSLGVPIISPNTAYSVRARIRIDPTVPTFQGNVHIHIQSTSLGIDSGLDVVFAQMTTTYKEFIGALMPAIPLVPADLIIKVYIDGTPVNGTSFNIDCVEVFETAMPNIRTNIKGSYADDPESFDRQTGIITVGQSTQQAVRCMFTLLDNKMYMVTERGLYSTQDDGQNEPNLWTVNIVSGTVGTGSTRGVGIGESWAVIAFHDGAYIFWGGEPVKITQEIQPDWDTINWAAEETIYVVVDTARKRIHIGAPTGASTVPNVEFVCDYSQLANSEGATSAQDIASHPQAYYSVYNPTKVVAPGKARKWTMWNLSMNCATLGVMSDGSYQLLRGNATGTGKVYNQVPTQLSDDGVAINSQYQTAYWPQIEDEQALQLGAHRKAWIYLTGYCFGSGVMSFTAFGSQNQRSLALSPLTLINPAHWDWEKNVNFVSERMSLLVGTNGIGDWFEMTKLCPTVQREVATPVRGNQ